MGFLNPFFLVGILAAGVPLLIHLWSRRRARTIDFSAIRFLVEAHRRSVRRFQLEQWFILLLRALALVCLSLALARPVVHGGAMFAGAQLRTAAAIVLDASASMGYRGVDGVPLDNGRDEALAVLRSLSEGDEASLVVMSDRADVLFDPATTKIGDVEQAARAARVTARGTQVGPAWEEAVRLLVSSEAPNKELYLISDFAENGWADAAGLAAPGIHVVFLPVGPQSVANVAVESIAARNPLVASGVPVELTVSVTNTSGVPTPVRSLRLLVNGDPRGDAAVSVPAGGTVEERFRHTFEAPGLHDVRAELSEDRLRVDDERAAVVSVLGQIDVLVVGSEPRLLETALAPDIWAVPDAVYTIRPTLADVSDVVTQSLVDVDAVCFQDVALDDAGAIDRVRGFLSTGGAVLVFLGAHATPAAVEAIDWLPVDSEGVVEMEEPAKLRPSHLTNGVGQSPGGAIAARVFGVFGGDPWLSPDAPNMYRAHRLRLREDARLVASFSTGEPAIVFGAVEGGRVAVVNTPAGGTDWSNLPLNPAFVPLVQQLLFEALTPDPASDRDLVVGGVYRRALSTTDPLTVVVTAPDGSERTVGRSEDGRTLAYTHTELPGVYGVTGGPASGGALVKDAFAVSVPRDESRLVARARSEVSSLVAAPVHWLDVGRLGRHELEAELARSRAGRELWFELLMAGLVLLLVETVLSNRRHGDESASVRPAQAPEASG